MAGIFRPHNFLEATSQKIPDAPHKSPPYSLLSLSFRRCCCSFMELIYFRILPKIDRKIFYSGFHQTLFIHCFGIFSAKFISFLSCDLLETFKSVFLFRVFHCDIFFAKLWFLRSFSRMPFRCVVIWIWETTKAEEQPEKCDESVERLPHNRSQTTTGEGKALDLIDLWRYVLNLLTDTRIISQIYVFSIENILQWRRENDYLCTIWNYMIFET